MSDQPGNRWDERYDHERYYYGEEPNAFIATHLPTLPKGTALFLGEGEGRNAVYAAGLGHRVLAVDSSEVGRRKALALAAARNVTLEYRCADVLADDWSTDPWNKRPWNLVVLCFAHLAPADAIAMHARVAAALAPGGTLLLSSFSKAQLGRTSGGPPRLEWLHDLEELRAQFPGLAWDQAVEHEVDLAEGSGHRGAAMVIEMIGRKSKEAWSGGGWAKGGWSKGNWDQGKNA
jgi:SAM-dependent methyltransferase